MKQAEQYISEHDTDIAKLQALAAKGNALLAQPLAVEEELQQQAAAIQKELNRLESGEPEVVYDSISPNIQWMDHKNEMIQAHGGCVIWDEATQKYYWYGEHKGENHTSTGGIVAIGVSCYSSTDLYNWKNEGVALPVFNNPAFLPGTGTVTPGEPAEGLPQEGVTDDTPLYLAESSAEYQAAKQEGKAVSEFDTLEKYNSKAYIARLNALYEGAL